jgi:hypothetical protein
MVINNEIERMPAVCISNTLAGYSLIVSQHIEEPEGK